MDVISTEVSQTVVDNEVVTPVVEEVAPVVEEAVVEPVVEPVDEPEDNPDESVDDHVYKYGSLEFSKDDLDISDDMRSELSERGLDIDALAIDLYDGDSFGLSEENLQSCYAVYGKIAVDTYLASVEQNLKSGSDAYDTVKAGAVTQAEEAWETTMELTGGKEGWDSLMKWSDDTLSDEEIGSINEVMENGTWQMQELVIRGLVARSGINAVAPVKAEEPSLDLVQPDGVDSSASDTGALTQAEYIAMLSSGEYKAMSPQDQASIDARRRAGISKNI